MKQLSLAALSASLMLALAVTPVQAESLTEAHASYQKAIAQNDTANALKFAEQSHEIGVAQLPADDISLANLKINWANLLAEQSKAQKTKALALYQAALSIYRQHYAEDAIELIDVLIPIGNVATEGKIIKEAMYEAIDIAEQSGNELLHASTKIDAFSAVAKTRFYSKKVQQWVFSAFDTYQKLYPEDSLERVEAEYLVASIHYSRKQYNQAIKHYSNVIKQMQVLDFTHPYELHSHSIMVQIFESKGDSEQATEHCLAIGKMTPWNENQEQTPLYRVHPEYPLNYAKRGKEGWVSFDLVVDENGFVKNLEVRDSEGGQKFVKESIKAIKQWRYAPKFENGKPVPAQTTVQLDFTLSRS
ncbi:TonB family protein [Shewanella maritima]|uniref:TonB family protein n=1 Tax=Shewanella maritima TaxID=2520507 RepID=UPI00373694AE